MVAKNKVVGCDFILGELYKDGKKEEEQKRRLDENFRSYITTGIVPNYFMTAKVALFSKNNQEYAEIKNIRSISIPPTITKLFETSIIHDFKKVTNSIAFNKIKEVSARVSQYSTIIIIPKNHPRIGEWFLEKKIVSYFLKPSLIPTKKCKILQFSFVSVPKIRTLS